MNTFGIIAIVAVVLLAAAIALEVKLGAKRARPLSQIRPLVKDISRTIYSEQLGNVDVVGNKKYLDEIEKREEKLERERNRMREQAVAERQKQEKLNRLRPWDEADTSGLKEEETQK